MPRRIGHTPSEEDFLHAGVPSAQVADLRLSVCRVTKAGKWHLRGASCAPAWTDQRYTTDELTVLGLEWDVLCKSCANAAQVPALVEEALSAVAELKKAAETITAWHALLEDTRRTWAWLDYARYVEHVLWARQPAPPDLTPNMCGRTGWVEVAAAVRERAQVAFGEICSIREELRGRMPDADQSGVLARCLAAVVEGTAVEDESRALQRIGGLASAGGEALAWEEAAAAWVKGRRAGQSSTETLAAMGRRLRDRMPRVHDLDALPDLDQVPVEVGDCVHTWARRSFHAHVDGVVGHWHDRLEGAYAGVAADLSGTPAREWAVLVPRAPLTRDRDAPLAFLSQFPVLAEYRHVAGEKSSWSYGHGSSYQWAGGWGSHPFRSAVLRVPEPALEHFRALVSTVEADLLTGVPDDDQRLIAGLLRRAGFRLLPEDFRPRRGPSALVRAARSARADDHGSYRGYPTRPFAPGARPTIGYAAERQVGWDDWRAYQALVDGSTFVFGIDDLRLLSTALTQERGTRIAEVSVEIPAGASSAAGFGGTVGQVTIDRDGSEFHSEPARPLFPNPRTRGPLVANTAGRVMGMTPDRKALMFAPAVHRDPFQVPVDYLVSVTFLRR